MLFDSPDNLYNKLYQLYSDEKFAAVLEKNRSINQSVVREEMEAKFELLKEMPLESKKRID
jgi:thiaminase